MSEILIIDLNWIWNKYYYIQKYKKKEEMFVSKMVANALLGFLKRVISVNSYKRIYLVMDGQNVTYQKSIYSNYKEGRNSNNEVYEGIDYFISNIGEYKNVIILKNDQAEGDEVIACLAEIARRKYGVVIFSGDKDMLQLTSLDNIKVSNTYKNGAFIILSVEEILNKFKNSKKEPLDKVSNILKYRVFKGDSSDKITPAIKGLLDRKIRMLINLIKSDKHFNKDELIKISEGIANSKLKNQILENIDVIERNFKIMSLFDKDKDDRVINNIVKIVGA